MSSTTLQKGKYLKEMRLLKQTSLEVQLIGENGNIFNLLGIVSKELKRNGFLSEADQLWKEVQENAKSYEEALAIIQEYVIVI